MLAMSGSSASAPPPGSSLLMNPSPHVGQDELCAVETGGCEFSVVGVTEVGEVRARAVFVEEGAVVVGVVVQVRVLVDSGSSP